MNSTTDHTDGNKNTENVDLTKPKVNLIDIASPNMTPEASKAVDYALERSMEKMRATPESNERKMVTIAVDKNLIPTVWCDPEIADLVTALNLAEIPTIASCSGHGLRNGNIALEDGRELIIAENFEEARSIENAVQEAENIRLTRLREEVTEIVYGVGWRDEPGLNKAFMPDVEAILYAVEKYNGPVQIEPPLVAPTERDIDEILNDFRQTSIIIHANDSLGRGEKGAEAFASSITQAKQAITSLIKELVAEAKPEVKAHPLGPVTLADCQRGLDHYEANLLKALEEV